MTVNSTRVLAFPLPLQANPPQLTLTRLRCAEEESLAHAGHPDAPPPVW